jgi:hypothetical protein
MMGRLNDWQGARIKGAQCAEAAAIREHNWDGKKAFDFTMLLRVRRAAKRSDDCGQVKARL